MQKEIQFFKKMHQIWVALDSVPLNMEDIAGMWQVVAENEGFDYDIKGNEEFVEDINSVANFKSEDMFISVCKRFYYYQN